MTKLMTPINVCVCCHFYPFIILWFTVIVSELADYTFDLYMTFSGLLTILHCSSTFHFTVYLLSFNITYVAVEYTQKVRLML